MSTARPVLQHRGEAQVEKACLERFTLGYNQVNEASMASFLEWHLDTVHHALCKVSHQVSLLQTPRPGLFFSIEH